MADQADIDAVTAAFKEGVPHDYAFLIEDATGGSRYLTKIELESIKTALGIQF